MFNYQVMLRTNSIFNTPNCFAVYVMGFYVNFLMKEYGTPIKAEEKMRELHGLMMKAIEGSHLTMRFEGGSGASVKTIVL
jgi:phosphoserine aminotransferase